MRYDKPSRPDKAGKDIIGFLSQTYEDIGLVDLWKVDIRIRDDYIRTCGPTSRLGTVGLGLHRIEILKQNSGLGQYDGRCDDALAAGT